jgi:hypothetical protein
MRRWLVVLVLALATALLGLSASGLPSEHGTDVEAEAEGSLYAAEATERADATGTFSGSFTPPSTCGPDHPITVDAGTTTIDVVATATLPTNDIVLTLHDPSGTQVAASDTATSPEAVHYAAATIAPGTWFARVCPFADPIVAMLPPFTYTGVYTTTSAPLPGLPGLPDVGTPGADAGTPTPNRVEGTLAFSPETIIDAQRTEGEPVNFFAPDGSYWESGPFGTSTQQSWVHRSTDNGLEFHLVSPVGLRPDTPPGGGDTDVVVDDQGFAYFSDLEGLTQVGTSVSNDGGNTWRKNAFGAQETGVDRQWYAMDNGPTSSVDDNTIFFAYRQAAAGSQILSSPGSKSATDPVGGLVWTNAASAAGQLAANGGAPCGKLMFDPVRRNLYMPCGRSDHVEVMVGHVDVGRRTGIDFHSVGLPPAPPKGDPTTVFAWLGIDAAGNVMVVWIDGTDRNVYESVSRDSGKSWTKALQVNSAPAGTNVFPQVVGGAAGKFVVAWYGNESKTSSDDQPANTDPKASAFPWYGYVAVITGADTLTPTIAQQRFTKHPMHYGLVCNSGTACTSGRTMADYFDVGLDKQGAVRLVFNDESSQYRQAHLMEVRQLLGAAPASPMSDPTGDAQTPHYGPGGAGPNQKQLDFTKLALSEPQDGILRVQMTVDSLASREPPPGKSQIVWLTRFQAKSTMTNGAEAYRIFYVGAKSVEGGTPTFFAGSGSEAPCLASLTACKTIFYPAEQTLTSGSVDGSTFTIDVSLQRGFGTGREIDGSTLYSVTALSYGQNNDTDLYLEGDATHAFDFSLGAKPAVVPQPAAKPAKGGSGSGAVGGPAQSTGSNGVYQGKRFVRGNGRVGKAAFRVDLRKGHLAKIVYVDKTRHLRFNTLRIASIRFGAKAAKFTGTGIVNGRRVSFVALAVDNGPRNDVFKIGWGGKSRGGKVVRGGVTVT